MHHPPYAAHIMEGIREVTAQPITHLIYSHSHADHIAGANALGKVPTIIAHAETKRLLERDNDANRPLPTVIFQDRYSLKVGSQVLELSYHGDAHEPGNIFIYAPAQQTLMVVDMVFPGWMPWRRFAVAHDIPGYFAQMEEIRKDSFQDSGRRPRRTHGYALGRGSADRIPAGSESGGSKGARRHQAGRKDWTRRPQERTRGRCSTTISIAWSFSASTS
jgi:glyoxylase-like metal-dependent hydrolase (beta-lactamase superfamily II)